MQPDKDKNETIKTKSFLETYVPEEWHGRIRGVGNEPYRNALEVFFGNFKSDNQASNVLAGLHAGGTSINTLYLACRVLAVAIMGLMKVVMRHNREIGELKSKIGKLSSKKEKKL